MKRLTTDNVSEMNMTELALNQVYVSGGCAWYIKAPDEECSVCDLIRNAAEALNAELPILSDDDLSSLLTDWTQYGVEEPEGVLAILYRALWAMAELREKLCRYEDTGLEPEEIAAMKIVLMGRELAKLTDVDGVSIERICELAQMEKDGRLTELPPNPPLTLEEYQKMEGEPVWIVPLEGNQDWVAHWEIANAEYLIISSSMQEGLALILWDAHYGETWLAYRRKPEEGAAC